MLNNAFWFVLGSMFGCVPALFIIQACRLAARSDEASEAARPFPSVSEVTP